ncbi:MAG: NACHT domain-containing protein [Pseudonocardia sp.]|nr:NACHT domain-containing protein [Pseudonocardia sp.]
MSAAGLEGAAIKFGITIANAAVRAIASQQEKRQISTKGLVELADQRLSPINRWAANRRIDDIGEKIARRLEPLYANEFVGTTDDDRSMVIALASSLIEEADIDDRMLFDVGMSARVLADHIWGSARKKIVQSQLGSRDEELLQRALLEGCQCLLQTVLILKPFVARAILEVLVQQKGFEDRLDELLSRGQRPLFRSRMGPDEEGYLSAYQAVVVAQLDHLDIFGIEVTSRLRLKLSLGYLGLSVETESSDSVMRPVDPKYYVDSSANQTHKLPVTEAFGKGRRFLVRGEAGSGKSTLLRWIAVTAALKEFTGDLQSWNSLTPFMLKLRSYASKSLPTVEELVRDLAPSLSDAKPDDWVHRTFSAGNGLLLIDGLDELEDSKRYEVHAWITGLLTTFPALTVIVTTRPSAVEPRWLSEVNFVSLAIEPLSPPECRAFVHRWHDAAAAAEYLPCDVSELPVYESGLLRELDAKLHLRSLASSPLLAAMICALNLDRDGQLPESRRDLYESALDLLLVRRDRKRNITAKNVQLTKSAKITILRNLALHLSLNNRTEISTAGALSNIAQAMKVLPEQPNEPNEVLEYLKQRSGVIREPTNGRLDFIHKTFQEFLTAQAVVELDLTGLLIENADKDRWREVILMFPAQATEPQRKMLIRGLIDRATDSLGRQRLQLRLLSAVCAQYLVNNPALREETLTLIGQVLPPRDLASAAMLASMGESVLPMLAPRIEDLDESAGLASIKTAAMIGGQSALNLLSHYASDSRSRLQQALIESWEYFQSEVFARDVLKDAALDSGSVTLATTRPIRHLSHLRNIRRLRIDLARLVRDRDPRIQEDLAFLVDVPQLVRLDLDTRGITNLSFLNQLIYIEELSLWGAAGLVSGDVLQGMAALKRLLLSEAFLKDGLQSLGGVLSRLQTLGLTSMMGSVDFNHLLPANLRTLSLRKCKIVGWEQVSRMSTIQSLRIERCTTIALPLKHLSELKQLAHLAIMKMPANLVADLGALAEMESLSTLEIDVPLSADLRQKLEDGGVAVNSARPSR